MDPQVAMTIDKLPAIGVSGGSANKHREKSGKTDLKSDLTVSFLRGTTASQGRGLLCGASHP